MAYPPKHNQNLYDPAFSVSERIPQAGTKRKDRFVHFDIDPCNVLVGANEPGSSHPLIPLLKLSDFGLARMLPLSTLQRRTRMLQLRRMAKLAYFTPEQFTSEWDFVFANYTPWTMPNQPEIAGNLGWRNNLFQIGLVMLSLITKCYPPLPPYPSRIWVPPLRQADLDDDDEDRHGNPPADPAAYVRRYAEGDAPLPPAHWDNAHYRFSPNPAVRRRWAENAENNDDALRYGDPDDRRRSRGRDPRGWPRVWSWGGFMLDDSVPRYRRVDRELRTLVAWCLCDRPVYRPRLRRLEWEVRGWIRRNWGDDEDRGYFDNDYNFGNGGGGGGGDGGDGGDGGGDSGAPPPNGWRDSDFDSGSSDSDIWRPRYPSFIRRRARVNQHCPHNPAPNNSNDIRDGGSGNGENDRAGDGNNGGGSSEDESDGASDMDGDGDGDGGRRSRGGDSDGSDGYSDDDSDGGGNSDSEDEDNCDEAMREWVMECFDRPNPEWVD
ncbi:hypothetical protein VTH82DRAFT_1635 [Thermothelomyces myriococcoides]